MIPPKVMWGVDDQIRELFAKAMDAAKELPDSAISEVKERFEAFAQEFEAMIFKEESILLMILLEAFTQDDWLSIAEESDAYGYAIIIPSEKWVPKRVDFKEEGARESEDSTESLPSSNGDEHRQVIETPEGQLTITFTPKKKRREFRPPATTSFWSWIFLSVEQANLILNHLPMEITFVNKDDIFQYYNDAAPFEEMIFKRTPSQVGRNVELCHPPKYLEKVKAIMQGLREGEKKKTSTKCGSNPNRVGNLSMSPMRQCVMKRENFKVSWNMSRISNLIGRLIVNFIEDWSKNELRKKEFMKEFEAWIKTQVMINEMALTESKKVYEEDQDERAKEAMIRYESRLDAYQFLQGKFSNYHEGKGFHDLPDGLFGERTY